MQTESDPNVIYGGDPTETTKIDENIASLADMVYSDLKFGEEKPSFINALTDKTWTFGDMLERSTMIAKSLYGAGIRKDDVVSIVAENRHEFPAIVFGTLFLNATVAPLNTTYTEREMSHAFSLSKPKVVFVSAYAAKRTIDVCKKLPFIEHVVLIDGRKIDNSALFWNEFIEKFSNNNFNLEKTVKERVNIRDQVALIVCSSGTTGLPKGVELTQENMMSVVQSYRDLFLMLSMMMADDENFTVINVSPWFHAMGFVSMFISACSRYLTNVFLPRFEEEQFLKAIETYKINAITVVPPIMVFLAKSPLVDKYDLSSIIEINCGAAALSKDIHDQVYKRLNETVNIRHGYGMSESTLGVLGPKEIIKPGSVGEPSMGVYCKIIDEDGKSLGANQRGELCFKGDRVMKGYRNDDEATSSTIDNDGWLHSGDIAYYDDDKQFYIVDRLKELIKYKAYQVPPAEIEGLLLSHPKIKDCGVVGIPDEESGELPFGFVVKQPGVNLTEKDVQDFIAGQTSKAKWLRGGVKFIEEIPKTASGKILRRELRDHYLASKSKL